MEFLNNLDTDVQSVIYLVLGAVLSLVAKPIFNKLRGKVEKTETKFDDQVLAKAEELVATAVEQLKKKGTATKAPKAPEGAYVPPTVPDEGK